MLCSSKFPCSVEYMAPKKLDAENKRGEILSFRITEEQAQKLCEAVEARGVPSNLNLSSSQKARWALLDWLDSAEAKRRK